jgi:hypothetical protein
MKFINLLTGFILMFVPRSLTCSCLAKLKIFSDECDYQYVSEDIVVIKNRQRVVRNSDLSIYYTDIHLFVNWVTVYPTNLIINAKHCIQWDRLDFILKTKVFCGDSY